MLYGSASSHEHVPQLWTLMGGPEAAWTEQVRGDDGEESLIPWRQPLAPTPTYNFPGGMPVRQLTFEASPPSASRPPPGDGPQEYGLKGGARGDGDAARMDGVRIRKISKNPSGPGLAQREGLCRGRSMAPDPHNYDISWDDRPLVTIKTDLKPRLLVDIDETFPSQRLAAELGLTTTKGQWQITSNITLPDVRGDEGICPVCYMVSDHPVCPGCGWTPRGAKTRGGRPGPSTSTGGGGAHRATLRALYARAGVGLLVACC